MDVSVIIVNYNTKKITEECIKSIQEKTHGIQYEIIVVDNYSDDGSREYFSNFQDIIYIYNNENLGFGRANNIGAEIASGRNLLFLNSDTLLINNAISRLNDFFNERSDVGVVGGNLYSAEGQPTYSYWKYFPGIKCTLHKAFTAIINKLLGINFSPNLFFNHTNSPIEVATISGADLMIRKIDFVRLGGFSAQFFMYYEETDLQFRLIHSLNRKIYSLPSAEIVHLEGGSQTNSKMNKRKHKMSANSRKLYISIHHTKLYVLIDRVTNFIYCTISRAFKHHL